MCFMGITPKKPVRALQRCTYLGLPAAVTGALWDHKQPDGMLREPCMERPPGPTSGPHQPLATNGNAKATKPSVLQLIRILPSLREELWPSYEHLAPD